MRRELPLLAFLLALGCTAAPPAPGPGTSAPTGPVSVKVVQPERRSLARLVEQPGSVQPFEETQLHARIPGYVEAVHADIGQKVKAGDVLAELAVPELVAEGKEKEAQVARAKAEVEQADKALAAAKAAGKAVAAGIDEAKAGTTRTEALRQRWASESERVTRLVGQGILDPQTADETRNQARAAEASHAEALARITTAEQLTAKATADAARAAADLAAAKARVEVAQAESARVQALLGFAKITAPYAGVVTRRRVNTGDAVQPTAGKGEGLFTVAKLDPVRIVIQVPEAEAGLVAEKAPVKLSIPALKGPPLEDVVTRTSWSLEPGSRTLRAEVERANADGKLRPGLYVHAQLTQQLPEAWTLPAAAVAKQGDGLVVFLVEGGKAVRVGVQVGHSDGKRTEVVRLQPAAVTGQEKIAASAAGLTDGASVKVEP